MHESEAPGPHRKARIRLKNGEEGKKRMYKGKEATKIFSMPTVCMNGDPKCRPNAVHIHACLCRDTTEWAKLQASRDENPVDERK